MPKMVDKGQRVLIDLLKIKSQIEVNAVSASNAFAGISTILSGGTTVVVSTTVVRSNAIVATWLTPTIAASHVDLRTNVRSITDGGQFTISVDKATIGGQTVGWIICNQLT